MIVLLLEGRKFCKVIFTLYPGYVKAKIKRMYMCSVNDLMDKFLASNQATLSNVDISTTLILISYDQDVT